MDKQYKKQTTQFDTSIWYEAGNRRVIFNEIPGNRHYEEYLAWLAEGNEPEVINNDV